MPEINEARAQLIGTAAVGIDAVLVHSADIEALLRRGYETSDMDYKGPGDWQSWTSAQKAELVRDMMAMGNADRPGWIILGVSQDANGQWVYEGLSADQAGSFDPSDIGKKTKEHADPEVRFSAQQVDVDGRLYVAVRVEPFATMPHICIRSSGTVLDEGAIYVRTEAAETAKIRRAEQMRRLIERAIQVHADAIVGQIAELVLQVQTTAPREAPPGAREKFVEQIDEAQSRR